MKEKDIAEKETRQAAIPIVQCENTNDKKIVCPVCGHANPEHTAICKMCSNYLI